MVVNQKIGQALSDAAKGLTALSMGKPTANNNQLNAKGTVLYRSLQQHLDNKEYTAGLEICEQILRSNPNHGETLCMKGLFEYHLGKKEAAFQTIKAGIKANLKSFVCWNIYAFVNKAEGHFSEALSCYKTVFRLDPENHFALRELAALQTQLGNWKGLIESRKTQIRLRPSNRTFWVALAIALYLGGHLDEAVEVLDKFDASMENEPDFQNSTVQFEINQISRFKLRILSELGKWSEVFVYSERLLSSSKKLFCTEVIREFKATALFNLGRFSEGKAEFHSLLQANNAQSQTAVSGWINCCLQADRIESIKSLCLEFPKSLAIKKELFIRAEASDEFFLQEFSSFLAKEIPSLWSQWKNILRHAQCVDSQAKRNLLLSTLSNASETWNSHLFLAAYHRSEGEFEKAFSYAQSSLKLAKKESDEIDSILLKAKIYKAWGKPKEAAEAAKECAQRDPRDRYLNSKGTKYLLLAGEPAQALELIKPFLQDKNPDNLKCYLEMQPLWLISGLMQSYRLTGNISLSLHYAIEGCKIFLDFSNEIFDFHNYCLRKMTVDGYVDLVAFAQKGIAQNKYFYPIVGGAIQGYLEMWQSLEGKMELTSLQGAESLKVIKNILALLVPKAIDCPLTNQICEFNKLGM